MREKVEGVLKSLSASPRPFYNRLEPSKILGEKGNDFI
jgi:hypothetical protein